ncbi:hypothetical protein MRX96_045388 [Rhipicephalus microplus]
MAGEPMKVPPPGYAEPPPSYQASMQGFQPTPWLPLHRARSPHRLQDLQRRLLPQAVLLLPAALRPYAAWLPQGTAVPTVVVNACSLGCCQGACVLFGCWFGCCLIPCCIPECQDVDHHCPSCKRHLCTYRRL